MFKRSARFVILALTLTAPAAAQEGVAGLRLSPAYVWMDESKASGSFTLENTGDRAVEVTIAAVYGVVESQTDSMAARVEYDTDALVGDLTPVMSFYPPRVILEPAATQVLRFAVRNAAMLPDGGYVTLMQFRMQQRAAVQEVQVPAVATGIHVRFVLVAPIVLIKGAGTPVLDAYEVSRNEASLSVMLVNSTDIPFAGTVELRGAESGTVYGAAGTVVFSRRLVPISLSSELSPEPLELTFQPVFTGIGEVLLEQVSSVPTIRLDAAQ